MTQIVDHCLQISQLVVLFKGNGTAHLLCLAVLFLTVLRALTFKVSQNMRTGV